MFATGGAALLTFVFGAAGSGLAGFKVNKLTCGLSEFKFERLTDAPAAVVAAVQGELQATAEGDVPVSTTSTPSLTQDAHAESDAAVTASAATPLREGLTAFICVTGLVLEPGDISFYAPWGSRGAAAPDAESLNKFELGWWDEVYGCGSPYTLIWEPAAQRKLGNIINDFAMQLASSAVRS